MSLEFYSVLLTLLIRSICYLKPAKELDELQAVASHLRAFLAPSLLLLVSPDQCVASAGLHREPCSHFRPACRYQEFFRLFLFLPALVLPFRECLLVC